MKKIILLLIFMPTLILWASDANNSKLTNMPEEVINQILSYSGLGTKQDMIGNCLLSLKYQKYITNRNTSTADKWEYFRNNITTKTIDNVRKLFMSNDRKRFVSIDHNNIMNIMTIDPTNKEKFLLGDIQKSINLQNLVNQPINRVMLANNTGIGNIIMLAISLQEKSKDAILFIDLDEVHEFKPFIIEDIVHYHDFKLSPNKKFALAIPHTADFFNQQINNYALVWDPLTGDIIWKKPINKSVTINDNFIISYGSSSIELFDISTGKLNKEASDKLIGEIIDGLQLDFGNFRLYGDYLLFELYGIVNDEFVKKIKIINIKSLEVLDMEINDKTMKLDQLKVDEKNSIAVLVHNDMDNGKLTAISLKTGKVLKTFKTDQIINIISRDDNYVFSEDGSLLTSFEFYLNLTDFDNFKFIKHISNLSISKSIPSMFIDFTGTFISSDGNTILLATRYGYDIITINDAVKNLQDKLRKR